MNLKLICYDCADRLELLRFWRDSDLVSVEGCCQNCGDGEPGEFRHASHLKEVNMDILQTIRIINKSW